MVPGLNPVSLAPDGLKTHPEAANLLAHLCLLGYNVILDSPP